MKVVKKWKSHQKLAVQILITTEDMVELVPPNEKHTLSVPPLIPLDYLVCDQMFLRI